MKHIQQSPGKLRAEPGILARRSSADCTAVSTTKPTCCSIAHAGIKRSGQRTWLSPGHLSAMPGMDRAQPEPVPSSSPGRALQPCPIPVRVPHCPHALTPLPVRSVPRTHRLQLIPAATTQHRRSPGPSAASPRFSRLRALRGAR